MGKPQSPRIARLPRSRQLFSRPVRRRIPPPCGAAHARRNAATASPSQVGVDQTELLLTFLNQRDAVCPRCDYNLRNLTRPICPECAVELNLAVSAPELPHARFLLTAAPGFFSGICAAIALLTFGWFTWVRSAQLARAIPWQPIFLVSFGIASVGIALVVCLNRKRFIHMSQARQTFWALLAWGTHIAVFCVMFIR